MDKAHHCAACSPGEGTGRGIEVWLWNGAKAGFESQHCHFPASSFFFFKVFLIIVDLQCSVNCCCTAKCPSSLSLATYSFSHIILHHVPSQMIRCSSQHYRAGPLGLSTPNATVCIYGPQTPRPSPSLPLTFIMLLVCAEPQFSPPSWGGDVLTLQDSGGS